MLDWARLQLLNGWVYIDDMTTVESSICWFGGGLLVGKHYVSDMLGESDITLLDVRSMCDCPQGIFWRFPPHRIFQLCMWSVLGHYNTLSYFCGALDEYSDMAKQFAVDWLPELWVLILNPILYWGGVLAQVWTSDNNINIDSHRYSCVNRIYGW